MSAVHVLLLEDDDNDAALVTRALGRTGLQLELTRARCRGDLVEALRGDFDIVVADYRLPDMTALDAVPLVRLQHPDVPVLLVTGALGEETATQCLRMGCSDYVLKDHLSRLPAAFAQCLEKKRLAERTRAAEVRLRAREARFRALVDNSTEAIALVDDQGIVLEMLGVRTMGYENDEVRGRSAFDLIHPEEAPAVRAAFADLVREPGGLRSMEFRGRHRSGEWLWLEAHGRNLLAEPAVRAVLLTIRDVSERHRMVEVLEESRESLRVNVRVLGSINAAMSAYLARSDWEVAHRSLLRDLHELTGSPQVFSVLLEEGAEPLVTLEPPSGPLADCGCAELLPRLFSRPAGGPVPVSVNRPCGCLGEADRLLAVPSMVGSELRGMVGILRRDGTDSEREQTQLEAVAQTLGLLRESYRRSLQHDLLERELLQSQKMEAVGRLAGGVAHDFNNLLTAIIGFGEIALREAPEDGSIRGCLFEMVSAGERAASLTRQLLAFSRRHVVAPRNLNLDALLEDLSKMLRRVIGEDVQMVLHPSPQVDDVWMDPGLVEQVVMNLVVNARDAMPSGGRLDISTGNEQLDRSYVERHPEARVGPHVRLTIRDTGFGMSPETRAHVFEPFFTTKEDGKGTGLGLATVYGVVKAAGGHIRLETAPGRGTTFDILLPSQPRTSASAPLPPAPALGHGQVILLVEDAQSVRNLLRLMLEAAGYRVLEAGSGVEAQDLARAEDAVDLAIVDVVLPGMNGREVAEALSRLQPGCRMLFMSGYTDDAILRAGVQWQEVHFLQKPFTRSDLLARVEGALAQPPPASAAALEAAMPT